MVSDEFLGDTSIDDAGFVALAGAMRVDTTILELCLKNSSGPDWKSQA